MTKGIKETESRLDDRLVEFDEGAAENEGHTQPDHSEVAGFRLRVPVNPTTINGHLNELNCDARTQPDQGRHCDEAVSQVFIQNHVRDFEETSEAAHIGPGLSSSGPNIEDSVDQLSEESSTVGSCDASSNANIEAVQINVPLLLQDDEDGEKRSLLAISTSRQKQPGFQNRVLGNAHNPVLPNGSSEETIRKTEEYAEKVENQNMKYQCAWHQLSADKEAAHLERHNQPADHCVRSLHLCQQGKDDLQHRTQQLYAKYQKSVGQIRYKRMFIGSCVIVGKNQMCFIITALHILKDLGTRSKCLDLERFIGSKQVEVQFEDRCFYLYPQILKGNNDLDYALIKIIPQNYPFPSPIKDFGRVSSLTTDRKIICIGFQNGQCVSDDTGVLHLANVEFKLTELKPKFRHADDFKSLEKDVMILRKCMMATKLVNGSSGGIIVMVDSNGVDKVLGIILKGYPKQFYIDSHARTNIRGCYLVEIILPMEEIYKDIEWQPQGKELLSDLFFKGF